MLYKLVCGKNERGSMQAVTNEFSVINGPLVVHSANSWMGTRADKSAMCTINRHLRFPRNERMHHLVSGAVATYCLCRNTGSRQARCCLYSYWQRISRGN